MNPQPHQYTQASLLSDAIEAELKRLNRWRVHPLPDEAFENMGAFGSNTMTFEQWLQFILLPRLKEIISEQSDFPDGSSLSPYAIRVFDGDPDSDNLRHLLYQLDQLVESIGQQPVQPEPGPETITDGDDKLPQVVYELIDVLPQFEGEGLEAQLQNYDIFLSVCSAAVRPEVSALLRKAASRTHHEPSRLRIEEAAKSIEQGGRAAEPYNHAGAMRKYQEEHKRNFSDQNQDN